MLIPGCPRVTWPHINPGSPTVIASIKCGGHPQQIAGSDSVAQQILRCQQSGHHLPARQSNNQLSGHFGHQVSGRLRALGKHVQSDLGWRQVFVGMTACRDALLCRACRRSALSDLQTLHTNSCCSTLGSSRGAVRRPTHLVTVLPIDVLLAHGFEGLPLILCGLGNLPGRHLAMLPHQQCCHLGTTQQTCRIS